MSFYQYIAVLLGSYFADTRSNCTNYLLFRYKGLVFKTIYYLQNYNIMVLFNYCYNIWYFIPESVIRWGGLDERK